VADVAARGRDELAALLALAELPGIGSVRLRALLGAFETALGAIRAPVGAIRAVPGFTPAAAGMIRGARPEAGHAILERVERLGAGVLAPGDPAFPPLLGEIPDPPVVLYAWGDVRLLTRPAVAIVGSRNHTMYGADAARLLAAGVAHAVVVVSGMARGIDALAHTAALDAGGASVGVLGNGFGVVYPAVNRALYDRMIRDGCLVTELPPGERPHAGAFSRRNRLISGLALATVVVEAAPKSGALITVDAALEQGRSVLAVPGPITSPTSLGCNRLIQQGAKPAVSPGDVLEELGLPAPREPVAPRRDAGPPPDLTGLQLALWGALGAEARHVDALVSAARTDTAAVLTALTDLELRGLVRQHPGMLFALILPS
jgi:DNA processing protein